MVGVCWFYSYLCGVGRLFSIRPSTCWALQVQHQQQHAGMVGVRRSYSYLCGLRPSTCWALQVHLLKTVQTFKSAAMLTTPSSTATTTCRGYEIERLFLIRPSMCWAFQFHLLEAFQTFLFQECHFVDLSEFKTYSVRSHKWSLESLRVHMLFSIDPRSVELSKFTYWKLPLFSFFF